jgi:CubicO group peptidase (beta-lactamase class C family)
MAPKPGWRDLGLMAGFPPPPDRLPDLTTWDLAPWNRWSFQNVRAMLPTVAVRRAAQPSALPAAPQDLSGVSFTAPDGRAMTVEDMLDETWTDGFLVMHRGRLVWERYFNDMRPATLHLAQSVSKSVTGAVAGVLWGRGMLDPDRPVTDWIPELAGSGYAGARLTDVLDMRSGIRFDETYNAGASQMTRVDIACGWRPVPAGGRRETLRDVILSLQAARPHGGVFEYRSIETDVLAWVIERAAGARLADLVAETVWGPIGAEEDACFTVDQAMTALADGGFNATLRDFARFGEMIRSEGAADGRQVVPADWVAETRRGDPAAFGSPYTIVSPKGAYRRQFWVRDVARGDLMARGVFGQMIYIDPASALTVVKLSTWPDYLNAGLVKLTLAAIDAIRYALD